MTMTVKRMILILASVFSLSVGPAVMARPATGEPSAVAQWSDQLWTLARRGDSTALDALLQTLPEEVEANELTNRFRESLVRYHSNSEKARSKQLEDRDAELVKMREHLKTGDLSKALRSAVTVQTLGDDLEGAFEDPDIQKIIEWAQSRIPEVEQERDWLLAQELLFYLRTLFEDTSRVEEYKRYDEMLEAVNRRVVLLADYAPKRLFELRLRRAERLSEKPVDPAEYKPAAGPDWRHQIKGIRHDVLKTALRKAANDHIEALGWRPLLRGGLEQLKLLATTSSLEESFPNVANPQLVQQWVGHIDQELNGLAEMRDEDLNSWTLSGILDGLLRVNQLTLDLPPEAIYREFGDGATYELDEFTEIIWPDKLSRFQQATEGSFVGVGILIRHNEMQEIVVVHPLEGTPAYYGGIKPQDVIAEVDGESTVGWSLNDAVDRITGPPGTKVKLGIQRESEQELVPIVLVRERIELRSVMGWWKRQLREDGSPDWDWYVDPVSRIAYIKLTQFTEGTYKELQEAWREITAQSNPTGLIIDVRYNPGGLLTSAVAVSNLFVKEGVIVSGENKDGQQAWPDQQADPTKAWELGGIAIVVLVNQGSASASEILAGCLQAHGAALVIGERSFGKGSVQTVHHTARNARLKLTTQYYRLPPSQEQRQREEPGRLVHKRVGAAEWGVDPDIVVKMTPQQVEASVELRQGADVILREKEAGEDGEIVARPDVQRLLSEGLDPQLETALLLLQAHALGRMDHTTKHAGHANQAGG